VQKTPENRDVREVLMIAYGQFCPVAKSMEIIGEK
jgi:hypothetical protein